MHITHPSPSDSPQRRTPSDSEKPYDLGVLFVHGIGEQGQGTTMVKWGETLLDWIRQIGLGDLEDTEVAVVTAALGNGPGDPACAEVAVKVGNGSASWLMTEAWWAESFSSPSFRDLVSWSVKAVPWAIAAHFARQMYRGWHGIRERYEARQNAIQNQKIPPPQSKMPAIVAAVMKFLFGVVVRFVVAGLLAPLILAVLVLLLIVGMIPIERVRSLVATLQRGLVGSIGDSLVMLENPIQAAAIRSRFRERLSDLALTCKNVAIVAHSQGAAVVVDGLASERASEAERYRPPNELKTLITFGAGVNKLQLLKRINDETESLEVANPWTINICFGAMVTFSWLTYHGFATNTLRLVDFWPVPLIFLGSTLAILLGLFATFLTKRFGAEKVKPEYVGLTVILTLLIAIVAILFLFEARDLVVVGFFFVFVAYMVANALGKRIKKLEEGVSLGVPESVQTWVDLYASADPVPNGPIRGTSIGRDAASDEIHNAASNLADHTSYWKNREQFVGPVAAFLAQTAGTRFRTFDIGGKAFVAGAARRKARAGWLRRARWAMVVLTIGILVQPWCSLANLGFTTLGYARSCLMRLPFGLERWVPSPTTDGGLNTVGSGVIVVAALAAYSLIVLTWRAWDAWDGRNFQRGQPASRAPAFLWGLVSVAALSGVAWLACVSPATVVDGPTWTVSLASTWSLIIFLGIVLGWLVSARLSNKTPGWNEEKVEAANATGP